MRWLPLAFVMGCNQGGVLEIRISNPDGLPIESVEVYAGILDERREPIRPAGEAVSLESVYWERDENAKADVQAFTGSSVTFAFERGDVDNDVEALVAVGLGAGKVPRAVAVRLEQMDIPEGDIFRFDLPLQSFEPLPRSSMQRTLPGLQLWGPPDRPNRCARVDNVAALTERFPGSLSALIVDPADPDCDGLFDRTDLECDDKAYLGRLAPARHDLSCARQDAAGANVNVCVAGGPACVDGVDPVASTCEPSSVCLPSRMCIFCERDLDCLLPVDVASEVSHISCTMPVVFNQNDQAEFCPQPQGLHFNLSTAFQQATLPALRCQPGSEGIRRGGQAFSDRIDFLNGGRIDLAPVATEECEYELMPTGLVPPGVMGSGTLRFGGFFTVMLEQPSPGRGLALPVVFSGGFVNDCSAAQASCVALIKSNDTGLGACIAAPAAPGTVPTL